MKKEIRDSMIACILIRGGKKIKEYWGVTEEEIQYLNDEDLRDLALCMAIGL